MIESNVTTGQLAFRFGNSDKTSFELFLPGENREVCQQLQQAAVGKINTCIYLWGQTGTGKSHLLLATCRYATEAGRSAAYIPLAQSDEIEPALLQGLDSLDLVCVDDIDRLAGSEAWEQALLHLYNRLRDARHSIAIAGKTAPNSTGIHLPDLKSRLSWGLSYHLKQLDDENKITALQRRARNRAFELPDEVASYLINRVDRDMPTLMDMLDRIDVASLAAQRRITIPFVRTLLDELSSGHPAGPVKEHFE